MIRNSIYAIFQGKEYRVITSSNGKNELISNDKADLLKGFYQSPPEEEFIAITGETVVIKYDDYENMFLREVTKEDAIEAYSIKTYGVYKKHEFLIGRETETQYELRTSEGWEVDELGFEVIDRGDYFKWVDKSEVDPLYERKTPKPNFFR